jgi:hypothetical protein
MQSTAYTINEASNLGNIRFFSSGAELYSWCESGCNSITSSNAVFWIKLPSGIAASSNVVVNMTFLANTVNYDGIYAGEAPQITCSNPNTAICGAGSVYGKYDNGAGVFNFYNNFVGSSLASSLSVAPSGVTAVVANGVSITDSGVNWIGVYTNSFTTTNTIADAYGDNPTYAIGIHTGAGTDAEWGSTGTAFFWAGGGSCTTSPTTNLFNINIGYSAGTYYLISYAMITGGPKAYTNYAPIALSAGARSYSPPSCIGLSGTSGTTAFYQWFRDRAYPPNGVMPTQSTGAIVP